MHESDRLKLNEDMNEYYRCTGRYRPKDIRRVVGDQIKSVKIESDPSY